MPSSAAAPVETPQPPPAPSPLRTEEGKITFSNLVLVAAPPKYRPFVLLDAAEEKLQKSKSRTKRDGEWRYLLISMHLFSHKHALCGEIYT